MENLNIEKFNPTKAQLTTLVDKCKSLEIKGLDDKDGYAIVDTHRKELKKARVEIQKTGKMLREDAIKFQKDVIAKEKEFIAIIEPVEQELKAKQEYVDNELKKIARKTKLPFRQEQLQKINVNVADEFLLLMDDTQYTEFFNTKTAEFLEEKERLAEEKRLEEEQKLQDEKDKIEEEKRKIAEDKRVAEEKEKARLEEIERAEKLRIEEKEKAEEEKQEAIEAEKKKAEEEKQRLINEQKAKEDERLKKEQEEKEAKEAEEKQKKEEQEKLEKEKKYQTFLKKNNYNEQDFLLQDNGDVVIMYKKIDEFKK